MLWLLAEDICYTERRITRHYDLVVSRESTRPDGYERSSLVVNGQFPGPSLEAVVGDRLVINVTNQEYQAEALSLHWHGIHQLNTPWYDGTAYVTNCPFVHGSSYVYDFTVDVEGTYWYHAHAGDTRVEGTYGMLVVRGLNPSSYYYDGELELILSDWYHTSVGDIATGLVGSPFKWPGNGDSVLFNGKGLSHECNSWTEPTNYNKTTSYSDGSSFSTSHICQGRRENLLVESGKQYLLRLLNAGTLAYFNLAIAGHNMTIVGAGGSATEQQTVESIDLAPGQRLEVLVSTNAYTVSDDNDTKSFLIRSQTEWRGTDDTFSGVGYAYLTYATASRITSGVYTSSIIDSVLPLEPPNESREWFEWNSLLVADSSNPDYVACPKNKDVDKAFVFTLQQQWVNKSTGTGFDPPRKVPEGQGESLAWTLNENSRLMYPSTPYLLQKYLDTRDGLEYKSDGSTPIVLGLNDIVDITIQNSVAGNGVCEQHPWHLHGHHFWLVGEGSGMFNASEAPTMYNTANPPYLDTVTGFPSNFSARRGTTHSPGEWMEPCGWITLRFQANNPEYPPDMAVCGSATYRSKTATSCDSQSNDNDDSAIGGNYVVILSVVVTFVGTNILCLLLFLTYLKVLDRKTKLQSGEVDISPMHHDL